jgi:DNA polymerase I
MIGKLQVETMPWLLLDGNNLCHRAWHAMENLSYRGMPTGVIYGFLRDITTFQERFDTDRIVFCFDEGISLRTSLFPEYKGDRAREGREDLYTQINMLKRQILQELGYSSVYYEYGYEADDWIAYLAKLLAPQPVYMVSGDRDLRQLLETDRVVQYNPITKSTYTHDDFVKEWGGLTPGWYVELEAIMGGKNNLPGIAGVGPVTAAKILAGSPELVSDKHRKLYRDHVKSGKFARNCDLIRLPWAGLKSELGTEDTVSRRKWNAVCKRYGLASLVQHCPRLSKGTI